MHPIRLTVLLSLALATIGGLSTCGGGGVSPSPPPPRQTAMVYEVRAPDASDGWVWRADITGRHPVRLTRGRAPAISPDGQSVAFIRYQANPAVWSVWTTDLDGATPRQVFTRNGNFTDGILSITWSPDSRRLAVLDAHGLSAVDRDGTHTTRLVDEVIAGEPVSFSPDSTRIAYADETSGRIFVVPAAGGPASPITTGPRDYAPAWGTTSIAFARWPAPGRPGDVWLVQPDGAGLHRLTRTNTGIQPVGFSADGRRLITQNPANHNGRIWAVDTQTGSAHDLTGWVGDLFPVGISRDGNSILAGLGCGGVPTNTGLIEVIAATGGPPAIISRGPCRASWNA